MADEKKDEVQAPDFLSMSDEELKNFDPTSLASASAARDEDQEAEAKTDDVDTDAEDAAKAAAAKVDDAEATDDKAGDGKGAGDEGKAAEAKTGDEVTSAEGAKSVADKDGKGKEVAEPAAKADADKDAKTDPAKDDAAVDKTAVIDYEAAYKQLTAPFKANGRDIQVKSVEDAIALMQMGANYNKKMVGMKPSLRFLKMLESNGLLDDDKLGFLIDLSKKDPAAISKLVTDSGINPLDLDADKGKEYRPGAHKVNDQELELDGVLDELKDSPHYNRTLQVVATQWDAASKDVIVAKPGIMTVIHGHMESGIYDVIAAEMESERTFGRLKGLSDLDAYEQVGNAINKRGGFDHLFKGSSQEQGKPAAAPVIVQPKPTQADEDKLREKKRAAGITKVAAPGATKVDFNPLAMSDEDFKKFK